MPTEYLIALPVEDMPLGATYARDEKLPLHCTVFQWFRLSPGLSCAQLNRKMMLLASRVEQGYIELVSERPALFGLNDDIPCHLLERNEDLSALHTLLLMFLATHCHFTVPVEWLGAGYRPHVTDRGEISFPPSTRHRAKNLVLVERNEEKKVVKSVHELG
ncbi:MAG: hypothetical protein AAB367_02065 [Patescibacteria group bacterium]